MTLSGPIFGMAEKYTTLDPTLLWWLLSNKPSHKMEPNINVTINTHKRSATKRVEPHIYTLHVDISHNEQDVSLVCFPFEAPLSGSLL